MHERTHRTIQPIILSAGESSRMGSPKALLNIGGQVAIEGIIEKQTAAGFLRPIVVLGYWAKEILAKCDLSQVDVVINPSPHQGPLSSLKLGLRSLDPKAEAFLLHPVDRSLVLARDLQVLGNAWAMSQGDLTILIPSFDQRRGHPIVVSRTHVEEIDSLPLDKTARDVVLKDEGRIQYVTGVSNFVLANLNTPEDYATWMALFPPMDQGP